jgi:signal transduction histidine kinase
MNPGSIRLRLLIAAAASVVAALAIAGFALSVLFERHVERRVESDLSSELSQIIAATAFAPDGKIAVGPVPADPRFATPLSGFYWQVDDIERGTGVRSRSLWDFLLTVPADSLPDGAPHLHEIAGPGDTLLVAIERRIVDDSGRPFRAIVAEDHRSVEIAVAEYMSELLPALAILAVFLIAAMWVQVSVGLAPLERLRQAVKGVTTGRADRLESKGPSEVQPLADEINRLLDARDKALIRARTRATDLAHGLKTPLQVLSADIRALREKGETALAAEIEENADTIRRHVERELARARVAPLPSGQARTAIARVAERVVAVVKRTSEGERLAFLVGAPPDLAAAIDEGDLTEILGNLVENAARFAAARVTIAAHATEDGTAITVSDDGPGIPDAHRESVLSRGVHLDAAGGHTGLGLAIVSDVVEAYGGTLSIGDAAPGLVVTIVLPGAR